MRFHCRVTFSTQLSALLTVLCVKLVTFCPIIQSNVLNKCTKGTRLSIRVAYPYEQAGPRVASFESPFAGCYPCNGGPRIFNKQEKLKNLNYRQLKQQGI